MLQGVKPIPVGLLSHNANGLRDLQKRRLIFNKFHKNAKKQVGLINCLQETHLEKSDEYWFESQPCKTYFSHGTNRSCGVAISFKTEDWDSHELLCTDADGRLICMLFRKKNCTLILTNIYSPNTLRPRLQFFKQIVTHLKSIQIRYPGVPMAICGDFNTNLLTLGSQGRHKEIQTQIEDMLHILNGSIIPFAKGTKFTWARTLDTNNKTLVQSSTIDFILANQNTIGESRITTSYGWSPSDHAALEVVLVLGLSPYDPSDRIYLDTTLLNNRSFTKDLNANLTDSAKDAENIQCPLTQWEFMKMQIRSFFINNKIKYKTEEAKYTTYYEIALHDLMTTFVNTRDNRSIDTTDLVQDIHRIKLKLQQLRHTESTILARLSKCRWTEYGERSNKYYMQKLKGRQNRKIIQLKDKNGKNLQGKQQREFAKDFFSKLYSSKGELQNESDLGRYLMKLPTLTTEQKTLLDKPLTLEELTLALKDTKKDTSPGSDAIHYEIYKHTWSITGPMLLATWKAITQKGTLTLSQKESLIILIPKKGKNPDLIDNLRPISLMNCDLKIITKALTNRLKNLITDLISKEQYGFVPGRQIHDLIAYAQSLILNENPLIKGYAVSLDAAKAYDTVNHNILLEVLNAYDFPISFIKIVQLLYSDCTARVSINNLFSDPFSLGRGVKQGDPLSCMLFILYMEPLLRSIDTNPNIKCIQLPTETSTKKTGDYADDIYAFVADAESVRQLFLELEKFAKHFHIIMNANKTQLASINQEEPITQITYNGNWFQLFPQETITVCGVRLTRNCQLQYELNFVPAIQKLRLKLAQWRQRGITMQGRILLAKLFGINQLTYLLQCLPIQDKQLKAVESILYSFIWKSDSLHGDKMARNLLKQPISEGGLNAPDIISLNYALKLRRVNRILSHPDLCHIKKVFRAYCQYTIGDTLDSVTSHRLSRTEPFTLAKMIKNTVIEYWKNLLQYSLQNDDITELDPQFSALVINPYLTKGQLTSLCAVVGRDKVKIHDIAVITNQAPLSGTAQFISSTIIPRLPAIYRQIINSDKFTVANIPLSLDLFSTPLSVANVKGKRNVLGEPSTRMYKKIFQHNYRQVRTGTDIILLHNKLSDSTFSNILNTLQTKSPYGNILKAVQTPQIRIFYYKLFNNIYPTRDKLKLWGIIDENECRFGCATLETNSHILFECPQLKKVMVIAVQVLIDKLDPIKISDPQVYTIAQYPFQMLKGQFSRTIFGLLASLRYHLFHHFDDLSGINHTNITATLIALTKSNTAYYNTLKDCLLLQ